MERDDFKKSAKAVSSKLNEIEKRLDETPGYDAQNRKDLTEVVNEVIKVRDFLFQAVDSIFERIDEGVRKS